MQPICCRRDDVSARYHRHKPRQARWQASNDPAYDDLSERAQQWRAQRSSNPGDPVASSTAALAVVDAEEPPLRILLGEAPLAIATADYESRLALWREWQRSPSLPRVARGLAEPLRAWQCAATFR